MSKQLRLWSSSPVAEDRVGFPCDAFRNSLTIGWYRGPFVSWHHEYYHGDEWHEDAPHLAVYITSHWSWGAYHGWYDGPHCSWSIGPIHINWSGGWRTGRCAKCESPSD